MLSDESAPPAAVPHVAQPRPLPDASALEDRLPLWFRSTTRLPVLVVLLGAVFFVFSWLPLWHTDLWGHLAYGRLIYATGSIPATEPLMPLARGVDFVDSAWLTQVIGYLLQNRFGTAALQGLAAACITAGAVVFCWIGLRRTGSLACTLLGLAALLWLEWAQLFGGGMNLLIRPQMAGMVAFVLTLAIVTNRPRRWHWWAVPLLFAAWANLHGSFVMGLVLLGTFAVGRGGDVLRRTDRFAAVLRSWPVWRAVLLTELAAAAVLLNPYGLRLYADVWLFSGSPNLADLVEWKPLTLRMPQGQAAAAIALALIVLYRLTPRRVSTAEALALLGLGGLTLWTSRMIVWFGPVAAYYLTVHSAAVWATYRRRASQRSGYAAVPSRRPERRSLWTVAAIGIAWIFFALTPFAQVLLHGRQGQPADGLCRQTPIGAAAHLKELPPIGQLFNTYEYGDYLLWTDPSLPVFVAGHAHLVPTEVWNAYMSIINGGTGWEAALDRYGVNTIVLDRPLRQTFIDRLTEEPAWEKSFQDGNAAVFRRREPIL